jgi:IS66 Orf2 like protein
MRKSFDSLHALVREHLELDAYAGHLFVAASRRRDRVKILEEGTYAAPFSGEAGEKRREITAQELGALLSGIDLDRAEKRKRPETMS